MNYFENKLKFSHKLIKIQKFVENKNCLKYKQIDTSKIACF